MNLPVGCLLLLGWCCATAAEAGTIRGTVQVREPAASTPAANPYPGRATSLPGHHSPVRGVVEDAVVYLDRVPAAAESALAAAPPAVPRLAQRGQQFVPRVIAIAAGSRVDFPNQDPIYHNVFSLSPARRFDLGKYPKGGSRQVHFPKPGLVKVYCDIHSDMEAFILVLPHHAVTRPRASGEFELPELPAGPYLLKVWHPDLGERSVPVEVPAAGAVTVNVGF